MKDYYKEIDKILKEYEEYKPYHTKSLGWAADRIDWCWKWRKITEKQMHELCNRIIILFNEGF